MRTSRLDFSGARNIINPEAELAKTFGQTSSTLDKMIAQSAEKRRAEEALKQQALQNQIAREGLNLRQAAGQREADKYARDVAGDEALRTYTQQLSNVGGMLSTTDADKLRQLYNKGEDVQSSYDAMIAPSKIEEMRTLAMPSGDYDPTSLIAAQEKAIAKPQGTLDSIVAAKAAEEKRIQANKDKEALAWQKEQWLRSRPKEETGTISMSTGTPGTTEYRETNIPVSQMKALQDAGWTIGKADLAGSGSGSGSKGVYASDGTVDQSKLINQNPKYTKEIDDMVSSMFTPEVYDKETSGKVVNQLAKIQMLTGKTADGVMADFGYLKESGVGRTGIDATKLEEYYKDQQINLLNPKTGVAEIIPMSKALKNLDIKDAQGNPYYNVTNSQGRVVLTVNPEYKGADTITQGSTKEQSDLSQPKDIKSPKNILDWLGFERPQRQRSPIKEDIDPETGFYRNQALEDTSLDFVAAGFLNKVRKIQATKNISKAAKEAAIEKVRKQFAKAGNQVEGVVGSPTYLRKQGTAVARDLKDEIAKATARRKGVVNSGATSPVKRKN